MQFNLIYDRRSVGQSVLKKLKLLYDWRSVSQSVCLGIEHRCGTCDQILLPVGMFLSEICGLVFVVRPLWWEDGTAICCVITLWSESCRTRLMFHLTQCSAGNDTMGNYRLAMAMDSQTARPSCILSLESRESFARILNSSSSVPVTEPTGRTSAYTSLLNAAGMASNQFPTTAPMLHNTYVQSRDTLIAVWAYTDMHPSAGLSSDTRTYRPTNQFPLSTTLGSYPSW
jgi:hypothetical protein